MHNGLVWAHREENENFHFTIKMFVVVIKMEALRNNEFGIVAVEF